jgi:hypothetical protein
MKWFKKLLKDIDSFAPDPWIVEGVEQARPLTQLITGIMIITLFVISFKFHDQIICWFQNF